jgi:hypothetical protein
LSRNGQQERARRQPTADRNYLAGPPSPSDAIVPPARSLELARALAALLVAAVNDPRPLAEASGVAGPGTARTVVGHLHPREVADQR